MYDFVRKLLTYSHGPNGETLSYGSPESGYSYPARSCTSQPRRPGTLNPKTSAWAGSVQPGGADIASPAVRRLYSHLVECFSKLRLTGSQIHTLGGVVSSLPWPYKIGMVAVFHACEEAELRPALLPFPTTLLHMIPFLLQHFWAVGYFHTAFGDLSWAENSAQLRPS